MKPVPHGEPYAGKLHVRFDEGAGVPHGASRSTLHPVDPRSCLVGLYEVVLRRIADITKCRVKAYKVEVYADGPGLLDSIFGDPVIEVGPSRPPVEVSTRLVA